MEEEPSKSKVQVHLDYGELIVKGPKNEERFLFQTYKSIGYCWHPWNHVPDDRRKKSRNWRYFRWIESYFREITFSGIDGQEMSLASGQSVQLAQSKLGESMATKVGGLVNLNNVYDLSLSGDSFHPPWISYFPVMLRVCLMMPIRRCPIYFFIFSGCSKLGSHT